MSHSDFYTITDRDNRGALILIPQIKSDIDKYKVFRNELIPGDVIDFFPNYGKKTYDLLFSGYTGLFLVSRFIYDLFTSNNISGWNSIPARIRGYETHEYFLLTVKGRCSAIDYEKSETFIKAPFTPAGKPFEAKRGLFFDLNSWDGSDIFTPEKTTYIFVTEKVKEILLKNRATNIIIENITEHERI
jgi:hypothetical protein